MCLFPGCAGLLTASCSPSLSLFVNLQWLNFSRLGSGDLEVLRDGSGVSAAESCLHRLDFAT